MTSQIKYPTEIAAGIPMAKTPALLSFLEDRSRGNRRQYTGRAATG